MTATERYRRSIGGFFDLTGSRSTLFCLKAAQLFCKGQTEQRAFRWQTVAPNSISDGQRSFYNEALFRFDPDMEHDGEIDRARRCQEQQAPRRAVIDDAD